jgi:hypothetical protein
MTTRAEHLAYALRLSAHIARLNRRLAEVLEAGLANGLPAATSPISAVCKTPCAAPVPWFAQGKGLEALSLELAEAARESVGLARDGSAGAMTAVHRAATRLQELAALVYALDVEGVRRGILETLTVLSVGKRERELARRIRVLLTAGTADGVLPTTALTYAPEAKCPGCGEVVPQDERLCPKCGIREGDPEQR